MLKVLFASSEAAPLAKVGGLGDVAGALPKALKSVGVDVRLVIPRYQPIETPKLLPGSQVPVYYVSSAKYFDREQIYGYKDDVERFSHFSNALLEKAKEENFEPDIIHVNDYHTALVPVLLKTKFSRDPFFARARTVLTIHNLANQGVDSPKVLETVGLRGDSTPNLGWDTRSGDVDLLLQGISEANFIVAVSPTYAREILTPEYGEGLEGKLTERKDRLFGILNGIDTEVYNPETDPNLVSNFSINKLAKRSANKESLVKSLAFPNSKWPLFGLVTRLVSQKGLDLLLGIAGEITKLPLNLVILGLGEERFENELKNLTGKVHNIKLKLEFNEGFARKIYASSDFFLVPSRFEPSGLTQMIAMRYGAVPVVRKTGGLADTVFDDETGIVFEQYQAEELLKAIKRALEVFKDKERLVRLQKNGMKKDFSWEKSAREYVKLYQEATKLPKELPWP